MKNGLWEEGMNPQQSLVAWKNCNLSLRFEEVSLEGSSVVETGKVLAGEVPSTLGTKVLFTVCL